jgi:hypothetical protein
MTPAHERRIADARAAMRAAYADAYGGRPTELEELQDLADRFSAAHGDTPRVTRDRRRRLA